MIGYYVHHVGLGHLHRARAIAARLEQDVVALSSLPRPEDVAPFADWVSLPVDDADVGATAHTAGGALHWAPLAGPGYSARMQRTATWVARARPAGMVVDTSVEVAALARLLGVPVAAVTAPGRRTDDPHTLLFRVADLIVAPWPAQVYRPAHLAPFGHKTVHVGAVSRFDGRQPAPPPGERRVLVLAGRGGTAFTADDVARAAAATPDWSWTGHGLSGSDWCADVWSALAEADVVVTSAGLNCLAEVAAARRPAVVIPQARPHDEQRLTATALRDHGVAVVVDRWPSAAQWPELLTEAHHRGAGGWSLWSDGRGAAAAAAAIDGFATRFTPTTAIADDAPAPVVRESPAAGVRAAG